MGVSGFGPAPHNNLGNSEHRFREGAQRIGPNDAPSKLARPAESTARLPRMDMEHADIGNEAAEPFDVRSSPQLHPTVERGVIHGGGVGEPVDGTSNVVGPQAFDVDDFRRWWRQNLNQESAEKHYRGPKLTRRAIALAGIALVSSALVLKEGATFLKWLPVAAPPNDIVRTNNPSRESAGTSADISTMPLAPVAPAQTAGGLASKASAQTANPEPARVVFVRPDGTLIASQVSTATERSSAAGPPNPRSKRMNGAVGTRQSSTELPVERPGKLTARVVVAKTERAADVPIPPLPVMTPATLEKEARGAQAALAPAAPADAANQSPNPLVRVLGDLFGGRAFDFVPVGSIDWAAQLGAPKSEAEAKADLKRLNTRYGSALKGATVGLRKVFVNGETAYRLQVVGLSRAEAAALCSRVRSDGGSCSIAR